LSIYRYTLAGSGFRLAAIVLANAKFPGEKFRSVLGSLSRQRREPCPAACGGRCGN